MRMKKALTIAIVLLSAATGTWAQQAASKVNLTMEQRHIIKETVKELKIQSAPAAGKIEIGDQVPKSVPLQAIPAQIADRVSSVRSHSFFVNEGQIVLVDPSDNKVVDIIE
jgi:hypothetical protein